MDNKTKIRVISFMGKVDRYAVPLLFFIAAMLFFCISSLYHEKYDLVDIFVIGSHAIGNVLKEHGLARPWRGDDQTSLAFSNGRHEVHKPGGIIIWL